MTSASGWMPHPDGGEASGELLPTTDSTAVALGAFCDLKPQRDPRSQSYSIEEFADLADGTRVVLRRNRGFTIGLGHGEIGDSIDEEEIIRTVLFVVGPDEDEVGTGHAWEELARLAATVGVDVSADQLKSLPYRVVLSDSLRQRVT